MISLRTLFVLASGCCLSAAALGQYQAVFLDIPTGNRGFAHGRRVGMVRMVCDEARQALTVKLASQRQAL
jgi:hypothetical protein